VKLLLFAHKPPPDHGQSYMVQRLLDSFGGDAATAGPDRSGDNEGITWYHVDCRLSDGLEDIGRPRPGKLLLLLRYCLQAIWYRYRFGVTTLFYQPAPGALAPVLRDWIVMALCRPFFKRRVFMWPSAGLGDWLAGEVRPWQAWLTRALLGQPDLSIVKSQYGRRDAEAIGSRQVEVVYNGMPDPCPDFEQRVLPYREARAAARAQVTAGRSTGDGEPDRVGGDPRIFEALFVGHCVREKGLFDTLDGVALANRHLAEQGSPFRVRLTVAGTFWREEDRLELERRALQPDLWYSPPSHAGGGTAVAAEPVALLRYAGYVTGERKWRLFAESDCFCFPTYYGAESFGNVAIEAMAFALPLIVTRWRMLPEIMPPGYPGLVDLRSPESIADALVRLVSEPPEPGLRDWFLARYTASCWTTRIRQAMATLERSS
jgi:glycosyltransferase involved in cell wall biosynthesis